MKKFLFLFVFVFVFFSLSVETGDTSSVYKILPTSLSKDNALQFPSNFETTLDWRLVLVNSQHPLTREYPVDLGTVQGFSVDTRIVADLTEMLADAKRAGMNLKIYSSHRTFAGSKIAFDRKVSELMGEGLPKSDAVQLTKKWIAPPGESEHNTGLALDIVSTNYFDNHTQLDHAFEGFPEYQWLLNHCAEYGFILRYPKDKQHITQITFEPWHFRYVGRDHAGYMMDEKICLEEYLDILSGKVDSETPAPMTE